MTPDGAPMRSRMGVAVLATTAVVALLWWAQAVVIPILLALLISYALEPLVGFLERHWCPRPLGVFLVLTGLVAGLGYGVLMNLWLWPFTTGLSSGISYVAGAPLAENLGRFIAFTLVTSLGFDIPRAITTARASGSRSASTSSASRTSSEPARNPWARNSVAGS